MISSSWPASSSSSASRGRSDVSIRRQLETELSGKSHGAEHAERIVGERAQRVGWGAKDPGLQILSAAERVLDPAVEVHQQGVDREVPPAEILLQGGRAHVRLSRL